MKKRFNDIENSITTKKILVIFWLVLVAIFSYISIVLAHKFVGNVFFTVFFGITVTLHTIIYCNKHYWDEVGYPKFKIEYSEPIRCEIVDIIGINYPINLLQKTELLLKSLDDKKYYRLCLEDTPCYNCLTRIKPFKYKGWKYHYCVPVDNYGDVIKTGDVVNVYTSRICNFTLNDSLWGKCSLFFTQLNTNTYLNAATLYGVTEFTD